MAKEKLPDEIILDALKKAYKALPEVLPLSGKKSLFAEQADLAEKAVSAGYLTKQESSVFSGKGAKKKETRVTHAVLTEAGIRKLFEKDSLKAELEALLPAVEKMGKPPTPPSPADFKAALDTATGKCVDVIRNAFAEMQQHVLNAITPTNADADPAPVLAALRTALERVEPVVVKVPAPVVTQQATSTPAIDHIAIGAEMVEFVKQTAAVRTVGCDFGELFDHLQKRHPKLTIGTFHDALRELDEAKRIRLGGWAGMLDDIKRPELAFFVSYKVMYYAHPSH